MHPHPPLSSPWAQAGGPADLALGELEHLHGLLHQPLVVALSQQPVTGTKVAEKLGQKGAPVVGGASKNSGRGSRWDTGGALGASARPELRPG